MLLLYPISFLIATFLMKSLNLSIFPNESYFLSSFRASVANLWSYPRVLGCSMPPDGEAITSSDGFAVMVAVDLPPASTRLAGW